MAQQDEDQKSLVRYVPDTIQRSFDKAALFGSQTSLNVWRRGECPTHSGNFYTQDRDTPKSQTRASDDFEERADALIAEVLKSGPRP